MDPDQNAPTGAVVAFIVIMCVGDAVSSLFCDVVVALIVCVCGGRGC